MRNRYLRLQRKQAQGEKKGDTAWSKCPPGQCPKLGSCASSGRALRLRAARHSQEEAGPLGTHPRPRVLEPAAFKAAKCAAFDDSGECERNPLAVMKECPKTCGVCTVSCMDHDPGCKGWAAASGGKLCESEEDKVLSRYLVVVVVVAVLQGTK